MRHLRLADRRGLLVGLDLSRVQSVAVEMMLAIEGHDDQTDFVDRFKLAWLSHNPPMWVNQLYPQMAEQQPKVDEEEEQVVYVDATDEELTDTTGKWEFKPMSREELAEMLDDPTGVITLADLDAEEGWQ